MNNPTLPKPAPHNYQVHPEFRSGIRAHFQLLFIALSLVFVTAACTTKEGELPIAEADAGNDEPVGGGECGELPEGQGECTGVTSLETCEDNERVQYECPLGFSCTEDSIEWGGTVCACDNVADSYCPDELCSDDPDCGEPTLGACTSAQESYSTLSNSAAQEANVQTQFGHFVALRGELNDDAKPDKLLVIGFYHQNIGTGTFDYSSGTSPWIVELVMDVQTNALPHDAGELVLLSGTLEIDSMEGNFTGSLSNAVFVDDRDNPTCQVFVSNLAFDQPIDCTQQHEDCIN